MKLESRRAAMQRMAASAALLAAFGCGGPREGAVDEPLRIAAAADLQRALPRILEAYGDRDGPIASPTFGASGQLAEQIRGGAPFDLFLSADMDWPGTLEEEGAIAAGSVRPYARGSLVLLVHADAAEEVGSIADLARPEVRKVAIANPDVAPYGKAARAALESAGLWESLADKITPTGSVAQAFLHVEQGNADAALVSRSLVEESRSKVVEIDPALYPPRIQGLGIVARSPRKAQAERFAAFLLGPEGGRLLAERGFEAP